MKLKELRIKHKTKPEELAKLLCISIQAYYKYENGTNEPNIDNLLKLADYYNVTVDYLLGREFKDEIGYLTNDQKNVVFVLKQLNDKQLNELLSTAVRLLNEK